MEAEFEEEIYTKIMLIVVAILVIIVLVFILDIIVGGTLFKSLLCSIVWYLPFTGRQLPGYLGCQAIPI